MPHLKECQHYAFVEEADENIMVYHVQDLREIRHWILGYGSAAQVIQPPELREWLREEAQRLINLLT